MGKGWRLCSMHIDWEWITKRLAKGFQGSFSSPSKRKEDHVRERTHTRSTLKSNSTQISYKPVLYKARQKPNPRVSKCDSERKHLLCSKRESAQCAVITWFSHSSQLWSSGPCWRDGAMATLEGSWRKVVGDTLPSCHLSGALFLLFIPPGFWIHCKIPLWEWAYSLIFREMSHQTN